MKGQLLYWWHEPSKGEVVANSHRICLCGRRLDLFSRRLRRLTPSEAKYYRDVWRRSTTAGQATPPERGGPCPPAGPSSRPGLT